MMVLTSQPINRLSKAHRGYVPKSSHELRHMEGITLEQTYQGHLTLVHHQPLGGIMVPQGDMMHSQESEETVSCRLDLVLNTQDALRRPE